MRISRLKKILSYGGFAIHNYDIRAELFAGAMQTSAKWLDSFKGSYCAPPTADDSITLRENIRCDVSLKGGKVVASLTVYKKSYVDELGYIPSCLFTFEVKNVGKVLAASADYQLRQLARDAVALEDEEIYRLRVKSAQEKLLQAA